MNLSMLTLFKGTMKSTKFKTKFTLLSLSVIFSLVMAEISLRFLIKETNAPRVYHDIKEFNLYEDEAALKTSYFRDHSFEIYNAKSDLEVLCLGDSFTNAGNTFWDNSYPYKLFLKLNKKVTVRNLGVCSSTTGAIKNRLEQFYQSKQYSPKKKYVIAIMAGSADIFSQNLEMLPDVDISKYQQWHDMNSELLQKKAYFLDQFYFYRVSKLVFSELKYRLTSASFFVTLASSFETTIENCGVKFSHEQKIKCLVEAIHENRFKEMGLGLKEHLVMRYLFGRDVVNSGQATNIIKDFMVLFNMYPSYLEKDFLVMNLIGLIKLQDKISFIELSDCIKQQSKNISQNAQILNRKLLTHAEFWYNNLSSLNTQRDGFWKEIISLANDHQSKLIVMNYPLAYQSTNSYLESMSKQNSLSFLNVEKLFSEEKNKNVQLIDDWEHCSPEGYDLIAENLLNKL